MRPIRKGDRGAAVEDVQRRLISLGADLGRTGVDGVFLGATYNAVVAFQHAHHLDEDGEVGPHTWAALVDATFALGDRLLYLRVPYLHGRDVRELQHALGTLGFGCGEADGIFGPFTERAVKDFQVNTALAADGIAGPATVRALEALRHVWGAKSSQPPVELRGGPARRTEPLTRIDVVVAVAGATGAIVERLVNVARAAEPNARIHTSPASAAPSGALVLEVTDHTGDGLRQVVASDVGEAFARRLASAVASAAGHAQAVTVFVEEPPTDEYALQSLAVSLLDGLCLGLAGVRRPVLP